MKNKRYVAAAGATLAIGAAVSATWAMASVGWLPLAGAAHHEPAPDVAYTRLDGTPAHLAQLRGQVVLVNFWATTCSVCVAEMPQVVATHERFKARGFETLAVAMRDDPPVYVLRYAASHALPFQVAMDHTGSIARSFGEVDATPTSVLINRRGEIVKRFVGPPDVAQLDALVSALLAES